MTALYTNSEVEGYHPWVPVRTTCEKKPFCGLRPGGHRRSISTVSCTDGTQLEGLKGVGIHVPRVLPSQFEPGAGHGLFTSSVCMRIWI